MLHHKSDMVAMRATAKAVKKFLIIINGKAWCFFIMKGTAGLKFAPCPRHGYTLADNIGQAQTGTQIIQKSF